MGHSAAALRKLAKYLCVPQDSPLVDVESAMMALWGCSIVMDDTVSIDLVKKWYEMAEDQFNSVGSKGGSGRDWSVVAGTE